MDRYLGKFVKLYSTGIMRGGSSSFTPQHYTGRELYVYAKVYDWNKWDTECEWETGHTGTDIHKLSPKDKVPSSTALLDVNLGVEFTLEEISEKDYPDILSKLEQGYKVEYNNKLTEEFKKLVVFNS